MKVCISLETVRYVEFFLTFDAGRPKTNSCINKAISLRALSYSKLNIVE